MQVITGTNVVWMIIVSFLSLDLVWDITGHHNGQSPGLFFLTLVFPTAAALLYLTLVCILVFRKLDEYKSLGKVDFSSFVPPSRTPILLTITYDTNIFTLSLQSLLPWR